MPEDILCFSAWNMSLELQTLWKYKLKFFSFSSLWSPTQTTSLEEKAAHA